MSPPPALLALSPGLARGCHVGCLWDSQGRREHPFLARHGQDGTASWKHGRWAAQRATGTRATAPPFSAKGPLAGNTPTLYKVPMASTGDRLTTSQGSFWICTLLPQKDWKGLQFHCFGISPRPGRFISPRGPEHQLLHWFPPHPASSRGFALGLSGKPESNGCWTLERQTLG